LLFNHFRFKNGYFHFQIRNPDFVRLLLAVDFLEGGGNEEKIPTISPPSHATNAGFRGAPLAIWGV